MVLAGTTGVVVDSWRQYVPGDLPVIERDVVRLVVLDADDRVLLLDAGDRTDPTAGRCWELPGGGIEADETYPAAAVRELAEETGIVIAEAAVDEPRWRRTASYRYRGSRRVQHERVTVIRLPARGPVVLATGRDADEQEDCGSFRWWPIPEVAGSPERFYPGRLPELLPRLLDGEFIDEPFELWS